jgi:hypothetical protein
LNTRRVFQSNAAAAGTARATGATGVAGSSGDPAFEVAHRTREPISDSDEWNRWLQMHLPTISRESSGLWISLVDSNANLWMFPRHRCSLCVTNYKSRRSRT